MAHETETNLLRRGWYAQEWAFVAGVDNTALTGNTTFAHFKTDIDNLSLHETEGNTRRRAKAHLDILNGGSFYASDLFNSQANLRSALSEEFTAPANGDTRVLP